MSELNSPFDATVRIAKDQEVISEPAKIFIGQLRQLIDELACQPYTLSSTHSRTIFRLSQVIGGLGGVIWLLAVPATPWPIVFGVAVGYLLLGFVVSQSFRIPNPEVKRRQQEIQRLVTDHMRILDRLAADFRFDEIEYQGDKIDICNLFQDLTTWGFYVDPEQ